MLAFKTQLAGATITDISNILDIYCSAASFLFQFSGLHTELQTKYQSLLKIANNFSVIEEGVPHS